MNSTDRLYFTDSNLLEFNATVLTVEPSDKGNRVLLDRTAFYPTGGGQPNDTGRLGDAEVVDVTEDESGGITHLVQTSGVFHPGQLVAGKVDARRRLDHLQQHSGQHILSQAFVRTCGAETRSFHLGAETSTIDIELQAPAEAHMRAAEEIANSIVFDDRPMRIHLMTEEQASQLPLRKESPVQGTVRIIEIEDFDWSPCGGTHAERAGRVGLIAIKGFERAKKMTRVEFVCGRRALAEYIKANQTATAIARVFSVDRASAFESVERTIAENKALNRRVRELLELALAAEAMELLSRAEAYQPSGSGAEGTVCADSFKLVQAVFDGRDVEELRLLSYKLIERERCVALLGTRDKGAGGSARLVYARSKELSINVGALLAESCQVLGGRGGGRPDMAQGGGPNAGELGRALELAAAKLK
jgi:alanyl-tRNA synthetase